MKATTTPAGLDWAARLSAWSRYYEQVHARAAHIDGQRRAKGWKLAASVGIPQCMSSLHNAACDDAMAGWCKGRPERLAAAKQANKWANEWRGHEMARRMTSAAYDRIVMGKGVQP